VAPPVTTSTTIIRYAEPITVVAANNEPANEEVAETAAEKSAAAMDRARAAFKAEDYVAASKAVDEAISYSPGDQVLHEFRALNLFALGKYSEATGVLHSVLASGPGWDWETMIDFYENPDRYTEQFRKLEDYVVAHPDAPEPHFLLGYHYLVGENLAEAYTMFDRVATLQPSDTVSRQMKSLLADSAPATAPEPSVGNATAPEPAEPDKTPIEAVKLHGIWKAQSAENKAITLSLTAIGTFSWTTRAPRARSSAGSGPSTRTASSCSRTKTCRWSETSS
jgi:tetratricopeptide (TPR) repeat protein